MHNNMRHLQREVYKMHLHEKSVLTYQDSCESATPASVALVMGTLAPLHEEDANKNACVYTTTGMHVDVCFTSFPNTHLMRRRR